ncbi:MULTISPECIES: SDR family NAD(P)-dependent oxidoreductase [unclassified Marinobacter]|uniref:SDR family NAD(P)-dependent oxidoreductase n=1 Tax=unclassified Marinobacter TaxID=83889 RepID=UPI00200F31DF|nr:MULTISPECIES: SDR family NAD(P)-dependent oxidoreductase [unclassified Marinobacter]UQG58121.1 SDR family oxidoreductase [Marinobacter sp. M4C]UQG66926.1 SDR family oxidoreductase [Marinobacter sp. M2C]UQG71206.1 SDR family oxidoreductase [Marinobacter sp. M1C]
MKLFNMSGRVALITGAGRGIGAAIAEGLVDAGASVVLADLKVEHCEEVAEQLRAKGGAVSVVAVDVRHRDACNAAVESAVSAFGRLDVLINCAGINTRKKLEDYSEELWDDILDTNLKGTFLMCQAAFLALKAAGGGKIINVGSILSLVANEVTGPYAASKGGILQITRALACSWAEHNITANVILPGWIDTPLSRQARIDIPGHAERVVATTPLRRWGEPADLAGAALFFASSASDFVTGASLVVDGGVTAHV